ncbi:MAG: putative Protein pelota, partial [Streblomastix strix]
MRINFSQIQRNGPGVVGLVPQFEEDFWHAYNIIQIKDKIYTRTFRRIRPEGQRSYESKRVAVDVKLLVKKIELDEKELALRIKGTIIECKQGIVPLGQSHTLTLQLNQQFTLEKDQWDEIFMQRLNQAKEASKSAELAVIVMQEGIAHICLVTESVTIEKAKIQANIPRKTSSFSQRIHQQSSSSSSSSSSVYSGSVDLDKLSPHAKAMRHFFSDVLNAMHRFIDFGLCKSILIGSPGFVKDDFLTFAIDEEKKNKSNQSNSSSDQKQKEKEKQKQKQKGKQQTEQQSSSSSSLSANRSKLLLVHTSTGHRQAVHEILSDTSIRQQLTNVRAATDEIILTRFFNILAENNDK